MDCNYAKGYGRSSSDSKTCVKFICSDGSYLKKDLDQDTNRCVKCDESCATCSEDGCVECKRGHMRIPLQEGNAVRCDACPEGYTQTANGTLKGKFTRHVEICGDGMNLGEVECDDGNVNGGDGCSSECRVEEGFECSRRPGEPDFCRSVISPVATLEVKKGNELEVTFSKKIVSDYSSTLRANVGDELKNYMDIELQGADGNLLPLTWRFNVSFARKRYIKQFIISTDVPHNIKGRLETFRIEFRKPEAIKDQYDNPLRTESMSAQALRRLYLTEAMGSMGSGFIVCSWAILILEVGLNPFKSSQSFWDFMNMLQILSYIPLLSGDIPANLDLFLVDYVGMSKGSFPFDSLPWWVPNPLAYLERFHSPPLNAKFAEAKYGSLSFVYNFSNQLGTWFLMFVYYILLNIGSRLLPKLE